MIFKAIEYIEIKYADEPLILEDINTLRKDIEKIFSVEECLLCEGAAHSAGPKCATLKRMLDICKLSCVPGVAKLLEQRFNQMRKRSHDASSRRRRPYSSNSPKRPLKRLKKNDLDEYI